MTTEQDPNLGLVPEPADEPPPEDGELGWTPPLEGGRTLLELSAEDPYIAPGQVTLEELLEGSHVKPT